MTIRIRAAGERDAPGILALRTAAADELGRKFGAGHWSAPPSEARILWGMSIGRVLVAEEHGCLLGSLLLSTRSPWSSEPAGFTQGRRAIHLTAMAVTPARQRSGVGRQMLVAAASTARAWPAHAIRLDAYDAPAGAGEFYERCGYREVGRGPYRGVPLIYYEQLLSPATSVAAGHTRAAPHPRSPEGLSAD